MKNQLTTLTTPSECERERMKSEITESHYEGLAHAATCQFKFIKDSFLWQQNFEPASGILKQFANLSITPKTYFFSSGGHPALCAVIETFAEAEMIFEFELSLPDSEIVVRWNVSHDNESMHD
jgi:hypothetical protein